MQIGSVVCEE